MEDQKSPSVVGSEQQPASEGAQVSDTVESRWEAELPTLDTVSPTTTPTPTPTPVGTAGELSSRQQTLSEAPLVDLALASVREQSSVAASVPPDEELVALRAELISLRETVAGIGSVSARVIRARGEDVLDRTRAAIKARPIRAIAWAMLGGFLIGAIR